MTGLQWWQARTWRDLFRRPDLSRARRRFLRWLGVLPPASQQTLLEAAKSMDRDVRALADIFAERSPLNDLVKEPPKRDVRDVAKEKARELGRQWSNKFAEMAIAAKEHEGGNITTGTLVQWLKDGRVNLSPEAFRALVDPAVATIEGGEAWQRDRKIREQVKRTKLPEVKYRPFKEEEWWRPTTILSDLPFKFAASPAVPRGEAYAMAPGKLLDHGQGLVVVNPDRVANLINTAGDE